MKTKIVSRYDSEKVIYESETETIREAVIEAVKGDADLRDADLSDADLSGADLRGADLRDAYLSDADFYQTKFFGRGGTTRITKSQVEAFHQALGIVVEEDEKAA